MKHIPNCYQVSTGVILIKTPRIGRGILLGERQPQVIIGELRYVVFRISNLNEIALGVVPKTYIRSPLVSLATTGR